MKEFTSVDTKTDIEKEDCFYLRNIGNEQFELAIAVASKKGFYKNQKQAACIVLKLILNKKGEILNSKFSNEVITLENSYDFTEYNIILENLSGTAHYYFLEVLLQTYGRKSTGFLQEDSSEDLIECLMSIFTFHAKEKYKIHCTQYGRKLSPKNNAYRLELHQRIKRRQKKQPLKIAA